MKDSDDDNDEEYQKVTRCPRVCAKEWDHHVLEFREPFVC